MRPASDNQDIPSEFLPDIAIFNAQETGKNEFFEGLIDKWIDDVLIDQAGDLPHELIDMPSPRVLLEVILGILIEIVVIGVGIEGISNFRKIERIPYLAKESIRRDAYRIAISNLNSIFDIIPNWIDFIEAIDGFLRLSHSTSNLLYPIHMK